MAPEPKTGVVAPRMEAFHRRMIERAGLDSNRASEVMAAQGEKILAATTVDGIWDADTGGTIQGRDVPGTVWEIRSVEPVISDRDDLDNTSGYYLSCDATYLGGPPDVARANGLIIGHQYALQSGAALVVTKLIMFEAAGALPLRVMLAETKTRKGRQVLRITRPPEMAQEGTAE